MTARLDVTGMGARDLAVDLERLNLVIGPMGSSKSMVSNALRFLALGHVPALGKREVDTAALMRGTEMDASLGMDGALLARSLARRGKGLKGGAHASWLDPKAKPTEHAKAILGLFGDDEQSVAEHIDLRGLMRESANKRAQRLETLLDATGLPLEEAHAWLEVLTVCRMAGQSKIPADLQDAQSVAMGLRMALEPEERESVDRELAALRLAYTEHGLGGALEAAGEIRRQEMKATKDGRAARSKIEDRRGAIQTPDALIVDLERERDEAQRTQAATEERVQAYQRGAKARKDARAAHAEAVLALEGCADVATLKAQAEAKRAEAEAVEIPPAPEPPEPDEVPASLTEEEERLEAQLREHATAAPMDRPQHPGALGLESEDLYVERLDRAREDRALADRSPWAEVLRMAEKLAALGVTEHAAETPEGDEIRDIPRRLMLLASSHAPDMGALEKRVLDAEDALDAVQESNSAAIAENAKRMATYQEALTAWEARRDAWKAKGGELEAALIAQRKAIRAERTRLAEASKAEREAYGAALTAREEALAVRNVLREQAQALEDRSAKAQTERARLQAAVESAEARLDGMDVQEPVDLEQAAETVATLSDTIARTGRQIEALQAADALDRELGDLAAKLAASETRLKVGKAAEHALQTLRERDLAKRGGPILERLSAFLEAAGMADRTPYMKAGPRTLDFGWTTPAGAVPLQALSGGETVLYMTGLAAAIIGLRKPRVGLLMVEAQEAQDHLEELLAGCASLPDGEIAHVVVAAQSAPATVPHDWHVIDMGQPVPAEA